MNSNQSFFKYWIKYTAVVNITCSPPISLGIGISGKLLPAYSPMSTVPKAAGTRATNQKTPDAWLTREKKTKAATIKVNLIFTPKSKRIWIKSIINDNSISPNWSPGLKIGVRTTFRHSKNCIASFSREVIHPFKSWKKFHFQWKKRLKNSLSESFRNYKFSFWIFTARMNLYKYLIFVSKYLILKSILPGYILTLWSKIVWGVVFNSELITVFAGCTFYILAHALGAGGHFNPDEIHPH